MTNSSVNGTYRLFVSEPSAGNWYVGIRAARGVGAYSMTTNVLPIFPPQPFTLPCMCEYSHSDDNDDNLLQGMPFLLL